MYAIDEDDPGGASQTAAARAEEEWTQKVVSAVGAAAIAMLYIAAVTALVLYPVFGAGRLADCPSADTRAAETAPAAGVRH